MTRRLLSLLLALCLCLALPLTSADGGGKPPFTVTDMTGREVELAAPAQRDRGADPVRL